LNRSRYRDIGAGVTIRANVAKLSDLRLKHRAFIAAYPFHKVEWRPGTRLTIPLSQARVALVTTAGLYLPGQAPFRHSIRHDDCSYREIPANTAVATLRIGQSSDAFDHAGIEADRNLAFPLDRLREAVADGAIGSVAPHHFSIMGSIIATGALIDDSGPKIGRKMQDDGVDAALLVPV
jgi:D-proline reductase (dithiol) PrdB